MSFEQDLIDAVRRKHGLSPEGTFKQEYPSSSADGNQSIFTRQWLDSIDRLLWPALLSERGERDKDWPDYLRIPAACLPHMKYFIHWHEVRQSWVLRVKNERNNTYRPLLVFENYLQKSSLADIMSRLHNDTLIARSDLWNCLESGKFNEKWTGYGCIDISDIGGAHGYHMLILFENADGRIMPVLCNLHKWQEEVFKEAPKQILKC